MSEFDFAIAGSDPAAIYLAGHLAHTHKKRVILVSDPAGSIRLPRQFYMSFAIASRPETLSLAAQLVPETQRHLQKLASRRVLAPVAPLVLARTEWGADALNHVRHLGRYFGLELERAQMDPRMAVRSAYRLRGMQFVRLTRLWPALLKWLDDLGVEIATTDKASIATHRDASVKMTRADQTHDAAQLVLADSDALSTFGHRGDVAQDFDAVWSSATLTEPMDMREPLVLQPETGFCSWHHSNGTVGVTCHAPASQVGELVGANLLTSAPARRAGQAEFRSMLSRDGGPVTGRFGRSGVHVFNGFGQMGLHFAPAFARFIVGVSTPLELAYFSAHAPGAGREDRHVAEFDGARLFAGEQA